VLKQIESYFPELTEEQRRQLAALWDLYHEWNEKINVISRRDIDNLYCHHVLHSLAIARFVSFQSGTEVLDVGTGGGFPGIPLAIMFPQCRFTLIDGTGKKIRVAQEVSNAIGLTNCQPFHRRCEDEQGKYDFAVSRAVMPMPDLVKLVRKNISATQRNAIPNGLICLKGGDLSDEMKPIKGRVRVEELSQWFAEEWFVEKYVAYLPL